MRIFKSLSLVMAVVLCANFVRADDNAAQAAARAALMQKMQEMDSGQPDNSTPPPMAPAPTPNNQAMPAETPSEPQPETKPEPTENTVPAETFAPPQAASPAGDNASQSAARAALMQKMQEINSEPAANPATAMPAATEPAPVATTPVTPQTNENSAQAQEQAIISQHTAQTAPQTVNVAPVPSETSESSAQTPAPQKHGFFSHILHPFGEGNRSAVTEQRQMTHAAPQSSAKNNSGFAPVEPPPLPVSSEQEAQLQALLEKYKANQITPEQYQSERAAIIGPR